MIKVDNYSDLKNVKAVAWSVRENADGDCMFSPDRIAVRFEDDSDQYWELVTYFVMWSEPEVRKNSNWAEVLLNLIFSSLDLLDGRWIGFNCTLSNAVNHARHKLKKDPDEETETWFRKELIF